MEGVQEDHKMEIALANWEIGIRSTSSPCMQIVHKTFDHTQFKGLKAPPPYQVKQGGKK